MSYKATIWVDDVPGIQEGTPQSAENFNNIEQGVFISNALGAMMTQSYRLLQDKAAENETVAIAGTITGASTDLSVVIPANKLRNRTSYNVVPVIVSAAGGTVGDLIVSAKQANGLKVKYTGTATSVNVSLLVQGGVL